MTYPRFDRPVLTRRPHEVPGLEEALGALPPPAPLPPLVEPALPPVTDPVVEALVPIVHRRIRVLSSYWHAGWSQARAGTWLRKGVADRLGAVAEALPTDFGLAVFDAWRPLPLQSELYDAAYGHPGLPPGFVSFPDPDPAAPPPHLTGGTVDVTLTFVGAPLALGGGFDDFTERARTDALEHEPGPDRDLRRLLYWSMRAQGFVVLDCEWWHFEHGTRRWAALTGAEPRYGPVSPAEGPVSAA